MQFKQVLLMFSALATTAYSFPTTTDTAIFVQNASDATILDYKKPLTLIVEDKNPKSESVVVEFVYNSNGGNSIIESTGADKDKYVLDSIPNKNMHDKAKHLNETKKEHSGQELNSETIQDHVKDTKSHLRQSSKNFDVKAKPSLMPEEESPLFEKWPKFYYDAFNPIQAFPELQYNRPIQVNTPTVQSKNDNSYLPFYEKERKEQTSVAGPPLSSLSMYDREFLVPIFD